MLRKSNIIILIINRCYDKNTLTEHLLVTISKTLSSNRTVVLKVARCKDTWKKMTPDNGFGGVQFIKIT